MKKTSLFTVPSNTWIRWHLASASIAGQAWAGHPRPRSLTLAPPPFQREDGRGKGDGKGGGSEGGSLPGLGGGGRGGGGGGKWVGASLISSLAVSVPRAVVVSSGECAGLRRFTQCRVVADLPAGLARAPHVT